MENIAQKLLSTGIALAGGFVGTKVVKIGWKAITGEDAPNDLDDRNVSVARLVTFATISAGISALIQVASQRGAANAVAKFKEGRTNSLGMEEV